MSILLGHTRYRVWPEHQPGGLYRLVMRRKDTIGFAPGVATDVRTAEGLTKERMVDLRKNWVSECLESHAEETGESQHLPAAILLQQVKMLKVKKGTAPIVPPPPKPPDLFG